MNTAWATLVLVLVTQWCSHVTSSDTSLNAIHERLINRLKLKQRHLMLSRERRAALDLRMGKLFTSHPSLECCPIKVSRVPRRLGISKHGVVVELLTTPNFTQHFYEAVCHPGIKDRPCQFLDRRYTKQSRCVQQFTYEYALVRTLHGRPDDEFRFDLIRVPTGCRCKIGEGSELSSRYGPELSMIY